MTLGTHPPPPIPGQGAIEHSHHPRPVPGTGAGLLSDAIAGLTVSFVAISLGAAFGILSGRGALVGIISAAIIGFITSLLGGTRIQCSGPTAPMTAVTATVVAFAHDTAAGGALPLDPDAFVNLVVLLSGLLTVAMGLFRLGRFIQVVPPSVVSGFMNGIAILIWVDQFKGVFGIGTARLDGRLADNIALAAACFVFVFWGRTVLNRRFPRVGPLVPVTLLTIVALSAMAAAAQLEVAHVNVEGTLRSVGDFLGLIRANRPAGWSLGAVGVAFPFAFQLALLCYLDTLLTSRVMDTISGETTLQNRELAAQGVANGAVAFLGGIPGAQATIRSVLILKEGATTRLAGTLVGVFVLIELLVFQDLIDQIPRAVFTGVLVKVGYDVFDWGPVRRYVLQLWGAVRGDAHVGGDQTVTHTDALFIAVTTITTLVWNLNVAVIGGTLAFHAARALRSRRDVKPSKSGAAVSDEN